MALSTTLLSRRSPIQEVHFSFSNENLNDYAEDAAPVLSDFFNDTATSLADNILSEVSDQLILLLSDNCSETTETYRIPSLVSKLCYRYYSASRAGWYRLRTQGSFDTAFREAVADSTNIVRIQVLCDAGLYFHPHFTGCNLDLISTTEMNLANASSATTTGASSPSAVPSAAAGLSASITQPAAVPTNEFRHNLLPSDVKKRYDEYQNPDVIVPVVNLVPFAATPNQVSRSFFHEPHIGGDKVILRNGGVLSSVYDSKRFHKTVPRCSDATFHGLRVWYRLFSGHGNACGIYIVPYELLHKGHGGAQGFEFDVDVPSMKSGYYFDWQNDILRALQHSSMFPEDSEPKKRVSGRTNGYYAIVAILTDSHPAFLEHPITLCKNWPVQKPDQTIFDFHSEFTEAIQLRAIFMQDTQDLNSPLMLSTFLHNCTHSKYFIQVSRLDRLDPTTADLFAPGTLAITLNNYLSSHDSPTQRPAARPVQPPRGSPSPFLGRPFQRRINALGEEDDPNYDAEFEAAMDTHMPAMIHQISREGGGPELRHCMFCGVGQTHLFDKCPILNDRQFLTSYAIRSGSAFQRTLADAFKRQKEARGLVDGSASLGARIHQVFSVSADVPQDDSGAEPSPASSIPDFLSADFVPGTGPDFRQG
jgi:hypothetical protein